MTMFRLLRFAAAALLACWPCAASAQIPVEGRWLVVEYDPLFPENPLFGQYRYEMDIVSDGQQLQITVSRTGAVYDRVRQTGDRLTADGLDPTRGMTRLDVSFQEDTFAGQIFFESRAKKIEGRIDPAHLALREQKKAQSLRHENATAAQRTQALEQQNATLRAQLGQLETLLSRNEQRMALLQERLNEQQARPPLPRQLPPRPAPARSGQLRVDIIEPPLSEGSLARVPDHGQDSIALIGRIRGAAALLSMQVNGRSVTPRANGLFQMDIARRDLPTTVQVVAVDMDGNRTARTIDLTLADRPTAAPAGSTGLRKAAASPASTCYQLAIVASPPDPSGPDTCRAAVKAEPSNALNHYHLGIALSRLGRHQEAVSAYREAAALWSRS